MSRNTSKNRAPEITKRISAMLGVVDEPDTEQAIAYVVDLIIDQAVEEARNQRNGVDGYNTRRSTAR